jgi:predicted LPLAT superfamily acyltransferase
MSALITTSRFPDPDTAYVTLVEARRGLTDAEAAVLDAKLVLILANHIGDLEVLKEAIALAKAER